MSSVTVNITNHFYTPVSIHHCTKAFVAAKRPSFPPLPTTTFTTPSPDSEQSSVSSIYFTSWLTGWSKLWQFIPPFHVVSVLAPSWQHFGLIQNVICTGMKLGINKRLKSGYWTDWILMCLSVLAMLCMLPHYMIWLSPDTFFDVISTMRVIT